MSKGTASSEIQIKSKDNQVITVESNSRLIRDEDGNPVYVDGIFWDVSDRKMAELEMEKTRSYLENVIDSSPSAIICCDENEAYTPRITLKTKRRGDTVQIQIIDNGPGMDLAAQKRIFDPFFTTKEVGQGTGLGLSVSYFIIKNHHNGEIFVDSTLEQGTTFTIHLPLEPRPVD